MLLIMKMKILSKLVKLVVVVVMMMMMMMMIKRECRDGDKYFDQKDNLEEEYGDNENDYMDENDNSSDDDDDDDDNHTE